MIDKTRAAANDPERATTPCLSRPEASTVLSKLGFWLNLGDENALSDGWRMVPWLTLAGALALRLLP